MKEWYRQQINQMIMHINDELFLKESLSSSEITSRGKANRLPSFLFAILSATVLT